MSFYVIFFRLISLTLLFFFSFFPQYLSHVTTIFPQISVVFQSVESYFGCTHISSQTHTLCFGSRLLLTLWLYIWKFFSLTHFPQSVPNFFLNPFLVEPRTFQRPPPCIFASIGSAIFLLKISLENLICVQQMKNYFNFLLILYQNLYVKIDEVRKYR